MKLGDIRHEREHEGHGTIGRHKKLSNRDDITAHPFPLREQEVNASTILQLESTIPRSSDFVAAANVSSSCKL
jgi:hypothetical protein